MIIPLGDAATNTGSKASALGTLLRAGLPVPDGFVIPFDAYSATVRDLDDRSATVRDLDDRSATVRGLGLGVGADRLDATRRAIAARPLPARLLDSLAHGLHRLGDVPVAVRSSADDEDTVHASGAGLYESVLAVRGVAEVASAIRTCWGSLHSSRAIAYRNDPAADQLLDEPVMAVLVQRLVDADVSGVMFTPADPEGTTDIEASWGLGPSVVGGTVAPDAYRVAADGSVTRTISNKHTRLDRVPSATGLVTSDVPTADRDRPTLDDATVARLVSLGQQVAALLGGPQDIEWAITGKHIWLLQARPITATPPPPPSGTPTASPAALTGTPASGALTEIPASATPTGTPANAVPTNRPANAVPSGTPASAVPTDTPANAVPTGTPASAVPTETPANAVPTGTPASAVLTGTPASHGIATGIARVVRGPADFPRVRPGDILVCPYTDPSWTPLLHIAAGVVTDTGGVLSHAAIIARELRIPAVLGIPNATTRIHDNTLITINGTTGTAKSLP